MRASVIPNFAPFNQWRAIFQAFQEARFSLLWVFKELTRTFALIWLPLAAAVFFTINYMLPGFPMAKVKISISLVEICFTVFLVPYFTHKFIQTTKGIPTENFRDFLTETITPLVFASIKALFIVLRHLIILFVPGVIKILRLALLHYTVFFDPKVRKGKMSAIEATQETTKGALLSIAFVYIAFTLAEIFLSKGLFQVLSTGATPEDSFLNSMAATLTYVFVFYWHAFKYTVMTHFYFILQQRK